MQPLPGSNCAAVNKVAQKERKLSSWWKSIDWRWQTARENMPKEKEEEESALAPKLKPAYSLYAQFNPAYLCGLCISPDIHHPVHTYHYTPIYMKHHNRFWLWLTLESFLHLTPLKQGKWSCSSVLWEADKGERQTEGGRGSREDDTVLHCSCRANKC